MNLSRLAIFSAALMLAMTAVACTDDQPSADPSAEPSVQPSVDPSATESSAAPVFAGIELACTGTGSPTLVLESGLGEDSGMWTGFLPTLGPAHRICTSSRAGLGASPPLSSGDPDPSPGGAAEQLHTALAEAGEAPPYVVLGFSYGGMVAQAFAATYPKQTAGLVLDDPSDPQLFTSPAWLEEGIAWAEGGRDIDQAAATEQLASVDLGGMPVFMLTQDQLPQQLDRLWVKYHNRVAGLTTQSVHVRARGAGHLIHVDRPALVVAAVDEVFAAAGGEPLAPCDERFDPLGGECL